MFYYTAILRKLWHLTFENYMPTGQVKSLWGLGALQQNSKYIPIRLSACVFIEPQTVLKQSR